MPLAEALQPATHNPYKSLGQQVEVELQNKKPIGNQRLP